MNFIEEKKTVSARSITVIFDFDISFNLFYFRTKIKTLILFSSSFESGKILFSIIEIIVYAVIEKVGIIAYVY